MIFSSANNASPVTIQHAGFVAGVALLLSIPAFFVDDAATLAFIPERTLIFSILTQQLAYMTLLVATCVWIRARCETFHMGRIRDAIAAGVRYGFMALPVIIGVSIGVDTVARFLDITLKQQDVLDWLVDSRYHLATRVVLIGLIVGVAPVMEELLFRGIVFRGLRSRFSLGFAVIVSALIFALVHANAASFSQLTVLAVLFSIGYVKTSSILTPILMHMIFNAASLAAFFYMHANGIQ